MVNTEIITPTQEVSLSLERVLHLARGLQPAVSKDDVTPVICTQRWKFDGATLEGVATDRYRVHLVTMDAVAQPGTYLIPRQSIEWLIKNSSFFGRPNSYVKPQFTAAFKIMDSKAERPTGSVTFTIRGNDSEDAAAISFTNALTQGKFPPVADLIEKAKEALSVEPGNFNMNYLAGTRGLASGPSETPVLRFINTSVVSNKSPQALITYRNGIALVQGSFPEKVAK